ncbi:hypothetical protein [Aureimonas ureilytica]|uniref:hypothetical protein n=1 Tax=Aureimonas ureilytica TaxID=401562 RepID=UPI000377650B|nr:hypothetical protein [Aureimonas ureilytica]
MSRRTQRARTIYDGQRKHLMQLAYELWQDCTPVVASLRTDCTDYDAVLSLQAATVAFSRSITGGESWVSFGSTSPVRYVPTTRINRNDEVDSVIAEHAGDPRLAIRVLLDMIAQLELDHERLLAQMGS